MNSSIFAGTVATFALVATASASPFLGMSIECSRQRRRHCGRHVSYLRETSKMVVAIDAVFGNASDTLTIGVDGGSFVQSNYRR